MAIINSKINNNPVYRRTFSGLTGYNTPEHSFLSKSITDNFNVSKAIPASDHQYLWITSSIVYDDRIEFPFGYATSSADLVYISSSEYTDPLSPERGHTVNYPLNLLRTDEQLIHIEGAESFQAAGYEVNLDNYTVRMNDYYTTQPTRTKVFMSRMNGPYSNPSWRTATHAVLQSLKRTSNLVLLDPGATNYNGNKQVKERLGANQTRYDISYISSKFKSLVHGYEELIKLGEHNIANPINLVYDYSNLLAYFPREVIDNRLNVPDKDSIVYYSLYSNYMDNTVESNMGDFRFIKYSETVWPKDDNVYLSPLRNRPQFFFNWRNKREERTENLKNNSQGNPLATSSLWAIDGREGLYRTESLFTTASTLHHGDVGELSSVSSIYHNGTVSRLTASALFSYPMPDSSSYGVFFTNDTVFNVDDSCEPIEEH